MGKSEKKQTLPSQTWEESMADGECNPPGPGVRDVMKAIGKLTIAQTKDLAFRLGAELSALDDIDIQYRGTDRNPHYMEAWLTNDMEASWGKIVDALKEMNMNVLAANIARQYSSTVTKPQASVIQGIPIATVYVYKLCIIAREIATICGVYYTIVQFFPYKIKQSWF